MAYPRQIHLGPEIEDKLSRYIEEELLNHYAERGDHIDDLLRWQKDYWAKPTKEKATFPFSGAATIVIPLSATAIEAVHARTETQLLSQPQLVTAQAVSGEWEPVQKAVEDYMNREIVEVMKIRDPLSSCLLEAEKFGTMIGKTGYERRVRRAIRTIGEVEQEFEVVYKQGAVFDAVPDSRFLMPYYAKDIQTAPWVGEEHESTVYGVEQLELAGMFREGTIIGEDSKLRKWISDRNNGDGQETGIKFDDNQRELENTQTVFPKRIDWVELWMAWDVDNTGIPKEIVVHYHRASRTIMSIRYNWTSNLRRIYHSSVYFPVEHRWRGIGICKMNEQFQREITTQHRQRLDNATLANMRMIKVSKMSGYGPGEPVFPGKMWFVDSMEHIDTFQLGEIYPSSYNNEQATLIYSQQRTGVNEMTLGMQNAGTPGTATGDLARIQEGRQKFDLWYGRAREFVGQIIVDVADLTQQFGPRQLAYYQTAENGQMVQQFFQMPSSLIRDGLLLKLKESSQQHNKILDRQNWQQVAGFIQQYYMGLVQLAQPMQNPQILQLIFTKGMAAATEALRQILETYDVRNIDRIIVRELEQLIQQGPMNANADPTANGQGLLPTGNSGFGGVDQESGMDFLTQTLEGIRNGGPSFAGRL